MATKKKMLQAAAGQAGGAALDITDVFSTYLYTGNSSTQTITNGIDLDGEGGMVWLKFRSGVNTSGHALFDTERGVNIQLRTDGTQPQTTEFNRLNSFDTSGFTLGGNTETNYGGDNYASWTFRKAPKFFDVVTYTGDGNDTRVISHGLSSTPAFAVVKRTSAAGSWIAWHTGISDGTFLTLNDTSAATSHGSYPIFAGASSFSDTTVTLGGGSGNLNKTLYNNSGDTYVLYLFAHNNGDGEFGPSGDADIIKCGSFTTDSNGKADVDLGFEAQWVMTKRTDSTSDWYMCNNMMGMANDGDGSSNYGLKANTSGAEANFFALYSTATGFENGGMAGANADFIYIAIRRGPMAVPESGTEVFHTQAESVYGTYLNTGFPVDMAIWNYRPGFSGNSLVQTRLLGVSSDTNFSGSSLITSSTSAEDPYQQSQGWDNTGLNTTSSDTVYYMWKRAPNFFDAVAYTGNGTAGRTVSHNLGVAPEMIWVKCRDSVVNWAVQHKDIDIAGGESLVLNGSGSPIIASNIWNSTAATGGTFSVGTSLWVNGSNQDYIAYLFASLDGVSKVGSYTGNGSSQTINCGFTSGARFILIKRTDSTGDWYVWDTERGIVTGNDPHLSLNTTAAEVTSDDSIDPDSSGFIVNQVAATNINVSSAEYIFYAVA